MTTTESTPEDLLARLKESVQAGLPSATAELSGLVRIPSVSWAAFDEQNVSDSADAVVRLVRGLSVFDHVETSRASLPGSSDLGRPAVLATRAARGGKPTILLYAHHDVQPPGAEGDWNSPPFEPTLRDGRLYGRGAADDKAGVMAHIAAIRALVEAVGPDFDLGLVLFIEGEEESGSLSFTNFLHKHREQLRSDVIVVADSVNWDANTPALTVALRGNVAFEVEVRTLEHASHSGILGGAVPDAMMAAVKLLSTLHDDDGAVAVAGLRSTEMNTPEYSEAQLRAEAALLEGVTPVGRGSILSRLWAQPAITVTGIDAPSVANASNTLLPVVRARVSVRVAPGQSASEARSALERHFRDNSPFGAHVTLSDFEQGDPFLVDTRGWAVAEATQAMAEAWGCPAVKIGIGGSIPFISDLAEQFPQAQIVVTGVEDPDSRAHSPNESLHLGVFHRAILAEAILLARLNERVEVS